MLNNNLPPYNEILVTRFSKLDKSRKPYDKITLEQVFEYVKNHPYKEDISKARELGKYDKEIYSYDSVYENKQFVKKPRNFYDHIKSAKCPALNYSAYFKGRRNKKSIESLTGLMYLDIDDFQTIIDNPNIDANTHQEAMDYVWSILTDEGATFIIAAWRSFGGKGFGFLCAVKNLTIDNYKSTFQWFESFFKQFGISLDKSVKDITRLNVLPYDENLFLKEHTAIRPKLAVEPKKRKEQTITDCPVPDEMVQDVMTYLVSSLYAKKDNWNLGDNRLAYVFYLNLFSRTNHYGIDKNAVVDTLLKLKHDGYEKLFSYRTVDEVDSIGETIYSNYASQHGQSAYIDEDEEMEQKIINNLFVEYSYNKELALAFIWSKLNKEKSDKAIYGLAIQAKFIGISKRFVAYFLSKVRYYDSDAANKLNQIYGNMYYPYGVDYEYTETAKSLQLTQFHENAKSNGYEVKKSLEIYNCELEYNRYLQSISNSIKISKKPIINFFKPIFYKIKELNISKEVAYNSLLEYVQNNWYCGSKIEYYEIGIDKFDFKLMFETLYNEIVTYKLHLNGLTKIRTVSEEELKNRFDIKETHILDRSKGEYLSDLDLDIPNNTIIWGDTGQGKTTWICNHVKAKRIILVPVIALLKGIDLKYEAKTFYEEKKNVQDGDSLIVCTYSSFPTLVQEMETWHTPISEYHLYMDEQHNFAASASQSYRGYELNFILDNCHRFKKFVALTGTLYPIYHPVLNKMEIVRVKWNETPLKQCTPVITTDKIKSISERMSKDKKNLIFLQSKNQHGSLGKLIEFLTLDGHKNISFVNASTKNSDEYAHIVEQELMRPETKTLIATSVLVEGITLLDSDVATIHFATHENDLLMEQFVNRFRTVYTKNNGDGCMVYMYFSDENVNKLHVDYDVVKAQQDYIKLADNHLDYFSSIEIEDEDYAKALDKNYRVQMLENSFLFRKVNNQFAVDYLSIANKCFVSEKYNSNGNIGFLARKLSVYNWKFNDMEIDTTDVAFDTSERDAVNDIQTAKQLERLGKIAEIVEETKKYTEDEITALVDDSQLKFYDQIEDGDIILDVRQKFKYLYKYFDKEEVHDVMSELVDVHEFASSQWDKIVRQIRARASAKSLNSFRRVYSVEFCKAMLSYYERKKKLEKKNGEKSFSTLHQLKKVVEKRKNLDKNLKKYEITEDNVLNIIKYFFSIEKQLFEHGNKYYLSGLSIKNDIELINDRLQRWAKEHYEKGSDFNTNQLATEINNLRMDLPILKRFKITNRNVMNFLNDYFTIERTSRRSFETPSGTQRMNVYKITSLDATWFESRELKSKWTTKKSIVNQTVGK